MTNPAKLQLVAKPAVILDDARLKKRVENLHGNLLAAAVRYIREGRDGSFPERVITASNLAGIPRGQLEAEAKR